MSAMLDVSVFSGVPRRRQSAGPPWLLLLSFLLAWVVPTRADALPPEAIPEHLRPWIDWVLADAGDARCPNIEGEPACVWPGRATLRLDRRGGTFELAVFVERLQYVALPGDPSAWPSAIEHVDGDGTTKIPVLDRDGHPMVELTPGAHQVRGRFTWTSLPEALAIPETIAFVDLRVEGEAIPLVKRDAGRLWLRSSLPSGDATTDPEHAELQVVRSIQDGVPVRIVTRLLWDVGGRAREIELPSPLVPGTIPLSVEGDLPLAIGPTGHLRVQLAPGHHEVTLIARTAGVPEALSSPPRADPWPAQEVWVWQPDDRLRAVEITGVAGIDPARTQLPEEWRSYGAYLVTPGDVMTLTATRRGEAQVPPNRLSVQRELWLDEAASAFTVRDQITGEMHQAWRLDLLAGELGQVVIDQTPQLITNWPTGDAQAPTQGVELRRSELHVTAVSRLPYATTLPAVGWNEDANVLSATLHLPPGWDVFASQGVDSMHGTWIASWNLFSVFYVLILSLAVARLVSLPAGFVAVLALMLGHGQSDAPEYLWASLIVLLALGRAVQAPGWSRLFRGAFYATGVVLLIVMVTFAVAQMRHALYPHLSSGIALYPQTEMAFETRPELAPAVEPDADTPEEVAEADMDETSSMSKRRGPAQQKEGAYGGSSAPSRRPEPEMRPDVVVQTGPGIPEHTGPQWHLSWSGPVAHDHHIDLWLITPWLMRVLTVLRVLTMFLLGVWIWRALGPAPAPPPVTEAPAAEARSGDTMRAPIVAALLAGFAFIPSAHAEEPSPAMLSALRARLLETPACAPNCATVAQARIVLGDTFSWTAEVHAGADTGVVLPGPDRNFTDLEVLVDGVPSIVVLRRAARGTLLRLSPGVHRVEMRGRPSSDRLVLELGTPPHHLEIEATGWASSGLDAQGRVESNAITLVREVTPVAGDPAKGQPNNQITVPASYHVHRTIRLGVYGRVETQVKRTSDATQADTLELALISGEQVTTPGLVGTRGQVGLSFARGISEVAFEATLPALDKDPQGFELDVTAPPADATVTETWVLDCGILWHCTTSGVVSTSHLSGERHVLQFDPQPGETLHIEALQPSPADGRSMTIDAASLLLGPGVRLGRGELDVTLRTSRAQIHAVHIPPTADLEGVWVNDVPQSSRNEDGVVRVSLGVGTHKLRIHWQESEGLRALLRGPKVNLGAPAVNLRTIVDLPSDRWLLLAGGPAQGPAILLWGYLVLLLAAAILLSRLPRSPLRLGSWLLLGLGLTHVPAFVTVFVAAWFFAVSERPRWVRSAFLQRHEFLRDLAQLALIGATMLFIGALTAAVYEGLVSSPDMDVEGAGSYGTRLVWFADRSDGVMPNVWVASVSIWVWRGVMLAWALWLASALLGWLRWAWKTSAEGGFWSPGAWRKPRSQ